MQDTERLVRPLTEEQQRAQADNMLGIAKTVGELRRADKNSHTLERLAYSVEDAYWALVNETAADLCNRLGVDGALRAVDERRTMVKRLLWPEKEWDDGND